MLAQRLFRSSREPRKEAKDASPTGSPLPALGPDAPPLRSKITTQASLQIGDIHKKPGVPKRRDKAVSLY